MTPMITAALAAAPWRKSSFSGDEGACVEVAAIPQLVAVRDSKDPAGPALLFPTAAWAAFAQAPPQR
ncbi:DUF397 domain-containing protein [Micromonospora saelicesensis]|uniref:DUF397 domain-containing protein n=1 Tax=Micromonospora saelicesensis TaxID=285676 RepID=A0A1C4TW78_9ACTN|nr:DUF397 domain-containing protein [Micromonospora saelicesensis]RAN92482.1 hypothetical protein GAR05_05969 [Micromonospora saelicesensis]RAO26251.1 hypothetical protein PSN13_06272 [Micromonospora saelicesensis]RAO50637.1 hypothetical protein GAR06_00196 [Micromonospora saelicesensis]RAO59610.1 hypothetical protein LUPAC06_01752 [Micromonospora saelicesensis]RAO61729.1 hypothetical protein PSN01_01453 [Micromonospora saelicesensis]